MWQQKATSAVALKEQAAWRLLGAQRVQKETVPLTICRLFNQNQ
jgi:hypothetical protein